MSDDQFDPYKYFKDFIMIPDPIIKSDLTWTERACYGALIRFAGKNGECHPKIKTISEKVNIPEPSVKRAVNSLIKKGFIKKERVGRTKNVYYFLLNDSIPREIKTIQQEKSEGSKRSHKGIKTIPLKDQIDPSLCSEKNHLKESVKKEKKIKKKPVFDLNYFLSNTFFPAYIDIDLFKGYLQIRIEDKMTMTDQAMNLLLNNLKKIHDSGFNVNEKIEGAIMGRWKGIKLQAWDKKQDPKELDPEWQKQVRTYGKERAESMRDIDLNKVLNFAKE